MFYSTLELLTALPSAEIPGLVHSTQNGHLSRCSAQRTRSLKQGPRWQGAYTSKHTLPACTSACLSCVSVSVSLFPHPLPLPPSLCLSLYACVRIHTHNHIDIRIPTMLLKSHAPDQADFYTNVPAGACTCALVSGKVFRMSGLSSRRRLLRSHEQTWAANISCVKYSQCPSGLKCSGSDHERHHVMPARHQERMYGMSRRPDILTFWTLLTLDVRGCRDPAPHERLGWAQSMIHPSLSLSLSLCIYIYT